MSLVRQISLSNWLDPPYNRVAFQRVRELCPTARIPRSPTPQPLPIDPVPLDDVMFATSNGSAVRWADHLERTYCDAVCVVHRDRIVHERYLNNMTDNTLHLLMSVSKSVCGAALGVSIGRGLLKANDLVTDVAPEFAGSSLDGATVRHVIDMTAGTEFVEDYDAYTEVDAIGPGVHDEVPLIDYERHAGYRPLGDRTPVGTLGHFRTYGLQRPHGAWFSYRSPLTNVAARLIELANDLPYPHVVARDLWTPLGAEHDADIMLDPLGHPVVEGGMSCSLRDLARFALAYLRDGASVVPVDWVDDTRLGDDAAVDAYAANPEFDRESDHWSMYRNAFWIIERGSVFSGLGIFGQYCWIDRHTDTAIARFSTYPSASPDDLSDETHRGFAAVAAHLAEHHT
jgi:CubicO group peptidase (beta-lactamase class C family)